VNSHTLCNNQDILTEQLHNGRPEKSESY